ncbi:Cytochrome c551 peroxidase [hydrothermal vent metagenome]|uniref:Cytochrome c551 peroxidase n=1 Tax=hydrothermal vent metagenome TaxID=652676 RepID=A0A1W1BF71_9ZZZZ
MFRLFLIILLTLSIDAQPITPLKKIKNLNPNKIALGRRLFSDTILSADNTISCESCHQFNQGGDDNLKSSFGIHAQRGDINAPTIYNAAYNFRQFWNGRAKNLKEQAKGPIENPKEMGNSFEHLIPLLKKSQYKTLFDAIYQDGITKENIVDALAEFEKTLITLNSPFDRYLKGDKKAITQKQKEGYEIFKTKGCISCHQGINIGGNLYNKFGLMKASESKRLGRYEITHKEEDKYYFKVPSLRNIEQTAPYLHDGRFKHLKDVIIFMSHYQLAQTITDDEIEKIIAFLKTLTGEIPETVKSR